VYTDGRATQAFFVADSTTKMGVPFLAPVAKGGYRTADTESFTPRDLETKSLLVSRLLPRGCML